MSQMSLLFVAEDEAKKAKAEQLSREEDHRKSWQICWGWEGPKVGEPLDIHPCIVNLAEPTEGRDKIYAYMERCIALEELPDGRWLCEIAMGSACGNPRAQPHYDPGPHDGTKVILSITDIWPPTRDMRAKQAREGGHEEEVQ